MKKSELINTIREMITEESEYQKFFKTVLDKFGVSSPDELSDDKKKEFFNYIDSNWKADDETTIDEATIPDYEMGDTVRVKSINKSGIVLTQYGRKVHIKFADGKEKTFDFKDIEKIGNIKEGTGRFDISITHYKTGKLKGKVAAYFISDKAKQIAEKVFKAKVKNDKGQPVVAFPENKLDAFTKLAKSNNMNIDTVVLESNVNEAKLPEKYDYVTYFVDYKGKKYPYYISYIDSTHVAIGMDKPSGDSFSGMSVLHVGQVRHQPYYDAMIRWMKSGDKSKIDKKVFTEAATRRTSDFFEDSKHGKAIYKLLNGKWNRTKVKQYFDSLGGGNDIKWSRIIEFIAKDLGMNPKKYDSKSMGDFIIAVIDKIEELYKLHTENINESNNSMLDFTLNELPAGVIASRIKQSDYKSIDKVRSQMIKILQKKDMSYSLGNLYKLIIQAAKAVGIQTESVNRILPEGIDKFPDMKHWWKEDKQDIIRFIYWTQRQTPPTDKNKLDKAWKDITKQLQSKYPAPSSIYDKIVNESVSSTDLNKIKAAVEAASSFMGIGSELKKIKMKYSFSTSPMPIYMITINSKDKVAIVNKKYASDAEIIVGDTAIGIMESKLTESEIKKGNKVIINYPTLVKPLKGVVSHILKGPSGTIYVLKDSSVWDEKYVTLDENYTTKLTEAPNPKYIPKADSKDNASAYILIGPKFNLILINSKYSDVGAAYYVYDKEGKYIGSANSVTNSNSYKKHRITFKELNAAKSITDLLQKVEVKESKLIEASNFKFKVGDTVKYKNAKYKAKVIQIMPKSYENSYKIKWADGKVEVAAESDLILAESVNESFTPESMGISRYTGTRTDAVSKFIKTHDLDAKKLLGYVVAGKLKDRMDFASAISGKPGNKYQKMIITKFAKKGSVNEMVGHFADINNETIVDSNFVNLSKGILSNSELVHMGMGNFKLKTDDGSITFRRATNIKPGPDFVGRPHIASDDKGGKLIAQLVVKMAKLKKATAVAESISEGKDDFVARHGKTNINLKKGYKHHTDKELEAIYDKLGKIVKDLKVKDANLVFEGNAFIYAAAKAKKAGKKEFEFNGKTYKVTLKADLDINESVNESDVTKKINRNGDEYGLLVKHDGKEYHIVYSADYGISSTVMPYGIVMPGDDTVSFLSKDRNAKAIWKQLKPKVDKFLKSNESVNESNFSEIDIMAKEAGSFNKFVKEFYTEYKDFPKDKDTLKWLKALYSNHYAIIQKKQESVNEGKKRFYRQDGIGKAKYTISYHDGKEKHKDGSDFYGIMTFKNKTDLENFRKELLQKGYREDNGYMKESVNEGSPIKKTFNFNMYGPNMKSKRQSDLVLYIADKLNVDRSTHIGDKLFKQIESQVDKQFDANKRKLSITINLQESVNEGVRVSLIDSSKNKIIKSLFINKIYRDAEKDVETLNTKLSDTQKNKGYHWKITTINEESVNEGLKEGDIVKIQIGSNNKPKWKTGTISMVYRTRFTVDVGGKLYSIDNKDINNKNRIKFESVNESVSDIDKNEFKDFVKYMNKFYGKNGVYSSGKDLKPSDILKAIDRVFKVNKRYSWGGGDSVDREFTRDELIKMNVLTDDIYNN